MPVLSLQSSVVQGHVGNSAALLPLQALGQEVWAVNTVVLSNHPGRGSFRGRTTPPIEAAALVDGLEAQGLFPTCEAILSGYLGDPGMGATVAQAVAAVRRHRLPGLYLCDPVMGDADLAQGAGLYVRPELPDVFRDTLVPLADIVTPNRFELGILTGGQPSNLRETKAAATNLRGRMAANGPRIVCVTSYDGADVPADSIDTLLFCDDGTFSVRQPRLARRFDGAGDVFAALFLGYYLRTLNPVTAVERATATMVPVLAMTEERGLHDLALTDALPFLVDARTRFVADLI